MAIGTLNVRKTGPRKLELLEEIKMKIDILVVTETKKKGKVSEELGKYYFIYSGVEEEKRVASGVGIMTTKSLKKRTVS
jgi:hypothetical protein